jgi:hypothetical protein
MFVRKRVAAFMVPKGRKRVACRAGEAESNLGDAPQFVAGIAR